MKQSLLAPTVSSFINQVEPIPADLTEREKQRLFVNALWDVGDADLRKRLQAFAVLRQPLSSNDPNHWSN